MKRRFAIMLVLVLTILAVSAGCSSEHAIVGTWHVERVEPYNHVINELTYEFTFVFSADGLLRFLNDDEVVGGFQYITKGDSILGKIESEDDYELFGTFTIKKSEMVIHDIEKQTWYLKRYK